MGKSRVFIGNCSELLATYDPESSCWRTSQMFFDWADDQWSDPLSQSGMIRNGRLYQLSNLEHPTCENGGSSLPTPTANANLCVSMDAAIKEGKRLHPQGRWTLWTKISEKLLPTPTAGDAIKHHTGGLHRLFVRGEKYSKGDHRYKNLPTPQNRTAKNTPATPGAWKQKDDLNIEVAKRLGFTSETIGKKTRLNPRFVAWMMGFPIDWLD